MSGMNLSRLSHFTEGFQEYAFHIGLDVHKLTYHVALRRVDGSTETWVCTSDPIKLRDQLQSLQIPIDAIAQESGPTGYGLARVLEKAGYRVVVAAPSRIPRQVRPGAKCDRLDCIKLAEYVSKGVLRGIAIPAVGEERSRGLQRRMHQLTDRIRGSKQRIKALLLLYGIDQPEGLDRWSNSAVQMVEEMDVEPVVGTHLTSMIRELRFLEDERNEVLEQLKAFIRPSKQWIPFQCLKSIPGVGNITALSFMSEVFRPERFERADELTSYLGLAPMVYQSGEKEKKAKLIPVGQARLRCLLIEAAWVWKAKEPGAQALYAKFISRHGVAQKAICALARRLAIIMWRVAVEQRPYHPMGSNI